MQRAIGYVRGSRTGPSEHHRDDLDAQDAAIALAARRLGLTVVRSYTDSVVDEAAPPERRPALINALGVMRPGDVLLVAERARLGAHPLHLAMIERLVDGRGGRIEAADERADTNHGLVETDGARMTDARDRARSLARALAHYERVVLAASQRSVARLGSPAPGRPADGPATSTVRSIVRAHAAAGWSADDIAAELDRRGYALPDGSPWTGSEVRELGGFLRSAVSHHVAGSVAPAGSAGSAGAAAALAPAASTLAPPASRLVAR